MCVCVCVCTHVPSTIIWKRVQDSKTYKTDRLGWNRQTQVGLYLIIFVSYTTTSITACSTQSSALHMPGTQLPVFQLTQFSSLVLYLFITLPPKWRCHESDEFFFKLFSATHMGELHQHSSRAQPFTLCKSKRDPLLPLIPGNQTSACSAEELTCWGGDAQHGLAQHTWPFLPELRLHFQGQLSSNPLLYKQSHILIKAIVQGELLQYMTSVCSCTYRWPTF